MGRDGILVDGFIDPSSDIEITFERIGTLRCRFEEPQGILQTSRWPVRQALQKYAMQS